MYKKVVNIPIFGCNLTVVLDKDLSWVEKKFKTCSLELFGAVTLRDKGRYRSYIVAFTDKEHLSNIVHEIVHIKNYIYEDAGINLDLVNDENEAYLSGWLFDEIYSFIKICD